MFVDVVFFFFLSFLFYYQSLPRCTRLPPSAAPNSFITSMPLSSHISHSITSRRTMIYEDNIVKQTQIVEKKFIGKNRDKQMKRAQTLFWRQNGEKKVKSILWLVKLIGVILFYGCKLDAVFFLHFAVAQIKHLMMESTCRKCFALRFVRTLL